MRIGLLHGRNYTSQTRFIDLKVIFIEIVIFVSPKNSSVNWVDIVLMEQTATDIFMYAKKRWLTQLKHTQNEQPDIRFSVFILSFDFFRRLFERIVNKDVCVCTCDRVAVV